MSSAGLSIEREGPPVLRPGPVDLDGALEALARRDAVAVPILGDAFASALLEAARRSRWRPARTLVGRGEHRVRQRMEVCDEFPDDSLFRLLTAEFQALWDRYLSGLSRNPFDGPLVFNDLMLQRYSVGEVGITPHMDRTAYRNLVCLFVLSGEGSFYVCDDRSGRGAREIPHAAGDVLLMRAPGFRGSARRPFHLVRNIRSPRYVFGLRQERI